MKEGKEEKVMGPLFPRLHVNDKEKGGPRAPPRNKMALYEQLSVPSQRLNSAPSTLPLPPHHTYHTSNLVPSASSSQGGGHERSMFSPFYVPQSTPAHSTEKCHSIPSDGMNFNGGTEFGRRSIKNGSYRTSNATRHLSSTADCNSIRPRDFSSSKKNSGKKSAEDDDFCVPTYQHGGEKGIPSPLPVYPGLSTVTLADSPKKSTTANCNSSHQVTNTGDKPLKLNKSSDLKSRIQGRNTGGQSPKETAGIKQGTEKVRSQPSILEKTEASWNANVSSIDKSLSASTNEHGNAHTGNSRLRPNEQGNAHTGNSRLRPNEHGNAHTGNSRLCPQTGVGSLPENNISAGGSLVEHMCLNGNEIAEKGNASMVRSESGSRVSLGDDSHRGPNDAENSIKESEGKAHLENVYRNDDDESDTSMVDSISALDISPDDVVGVIGQKHFWKARKAIVNQQRVFAVQVFELHRLMKVQKLIAGSPDMWIEGNPCLSRPMKVPAKKTTSEYSLKSQPQTILQKDAQKPGQNTDCPSLKDDSQKLCIPPVDGVEKELVSQNSNHGPYPGNTFPVNPAADNSSGPWCFHPHGNQWLVPIMSPSEGLVYKPYMGHCPPNIGYMTPVYGGCGPLGLPPAPAYGVQACHPQPGAGVIPGAPMAAQNYFPPAFGLPVMSPMISNPAVEQVNPSAGTQPHQQSKQVSTREVDFNMQSRSSCNISNQKSEAFSRFDQKVQTSKDSEVRGSTASSPCERAQEAGNVMEGREVRDALPLFPVGPSTASSDQTPHILGGDQNTRVIKVVPHNRRSATESAAWIFQSIQKERQQYHLQ